ncbi:MAG: TIGR03067 domain-containing protein [Candidatus Eisenbacteria bacterium]|nr:TIGR03067 domain-containing protein [Candidatus Eisenbacteria bacterium]
MNIRAIAALLLSLTLAAFGTGCRCDCTDAAKVVGTWVPESAELGGAAFPLSSFDGAELHLTADGYEFAGDKGTYRVLSDAWPMPMDIMGKEGPNAGRTIPAICTLAGDKLIVCYQLGPGERPTAFVSPAGTQVFLVRYKRAQ